MTADAVDGARYVVLGDVVGSREIDDREAFRETFADARRRIADEYADDVAAGPSVLKGIDEMAAVLTSLETFYDVVLVLHDALYPHGIRLAVASGEIEVGGNGDVAHMDGEAFHRATELLESIEADDLRVGLDTGADPLDTAVADEINLLVHLRESWTDRQRDVVGRYERAGTQRAVAEELAVSQQAVSNVLQGASWPLVETVEARLRRTLAAYDEVDDG
ncbi:SatD family protein [Halovivax sp.]|uniref:SatD family protein n=1 Tax=Halovivax sp. TaxID=1935978 RepID=UPI0025B9A714|nr:SatD family protein [Halovivax sp.]